MPCDVLVPAAVERVIHASNAALLRCRVLAEAANGPTTPEADEVLDQRRDEIFVIPDVLCNAGGVITSYFEWVQDMQSLFWTDIEMTDRLYRILDTAFSAVIKRPKSVMFPRARRPWPSASSVCWKRSGIAGCFREIPVATAGAKQKRPRRRRS